VVVYRVSLKGYSLWGYTVQLQCRKSMSCLSIYVHLLYAYKLIYSSGVIVLYVYCWVPSRVSAHNELLLAEQVREYVERQWTKILSGRVSLADFVFAKEVRLGTYRAAGGNLPPAALVAGKAMATDPRMEPRYGERVPYVVVYGEPGNPPSLHPLCEGLEASIEEESLKFWVKLLFGYSLCSRL